MKVLVATKETQGNRKNDFCWCDEGELVRHGTECSREKIDGRCGCRRSLVGMKTSKASTTMKVVERNITQAQLEDELTNSLKRDGWITSLTKNDKLIIKRDAQELSNIANFFPVNSVIERRGKRFKIRT